MTPPGDCTLTLLADDRVRVDHADPRIRIAAEVVHDLRDGVKPRGRGISLDGDLLRIEGVNRTVIYCIGDKDPRSHSYFAEWPD